MRVVFVLDDHVTFFIYRHARPLMTPLFLFVFSLKPPLCIIARVALELQAILNSFSDAHLSLMPKAPDGESLFKKQDAFADIHFSITDIQLKHFTRTVVSRASTASGSAGTLGRLNITGRAAAGSRCGLNLLNITG